MARKTEHFDYHVGLGAGLYANSSLGAAGQVLKSDGTNVYWGNDSSSGGDAATLDGYDSTAFALLAAENVFTLKQTINLNTSTAASPGTTGVTLHLSGSDGVTTRLWLDSYGVATNYTARRTNGTNAAKTALLAADIIMNNSAFGYDGVAYSTSSRGSMQIRASQNWAVGAHGTRLVMLTTADSTTTQTERWVFEQDGSLIYSGGSATGNGTVNANDYFDNGVNINTIYLASASYTAADVLSKLLTVDGSGSGLDADLLDGQQGSAYALVGSSNIFSATQSIQISGGLSALTIGHTAASSSSQLILRGDAATYRMAFFNTGAAARFAYGVDNVAESGSNAGSNFFFQSYDDAGTFLGTILTANRNTRVVSFGQTPTVSSSTMWHAGNDGAGSGLDADLLDGNSSAYYLAASTYTAADVLSKLLTVDGAGSGLDADLLDGKNTGTSGNVVGLLDGNNTYSGTSTFTNTVNATHTTNGAPNIRWGSLDAISSDTSANALFGRNAYYDATAATYKIYATSIGGWGLIKVGGDTLQFSGASGSVTAGTSITPTWYNIWHENNDGSGSGLDADLWDGNQFSTYLNQAVLSTSSPVFSALRLTLSTGRQFYIRQWADFSDNYSGYAVMGANLYSQPDTSTYITPNTHASVGYAAIRMVQNTIQFAGFSGATTAGATVTPTWNTVWHAGNDGAGSGLDADLWDGNQFASYLNQAVLTSSGPTFAGLTSTASIQTTGVAEALRIRNDSGYISVFDSANSTRTGYIQFNTGSTLVMHNEATNGALNLRTTGSGVVQINGNTAWHAGNDGAGSGLDADLLDGNNIGTSGTAVPLLSGTNTWGGNQTFSGQITLGGSGTRYAIFDSNDYIEYAGASDQWAIRIGNTAYLTLTASLTNVISTSLQHNGNTVWTAANDGSGSGLDADLLDGYNVGTSGGTIPLLNGNNTYSGTSSFTGAVTISRGAVPLQITTTVDNGNVEGFILEGDRATPSANDIVYMNWRLSNSAGTQTEFGRQSIVASTVTAASEASYWMWAVRAAGTLTNVMRLSSTALSPQTSDGLALGATSLMWSDLFLASGAVVNFNNGDVTVTHSTNTLAFAGASSGYTFDAAVSATGLNLNSATTFLPQATITNTNNDATAGYVIFYKTPADTTVTANDYLGTVLWYGHGSSSASGTAASIYARAEGTRGTDWVASNLYLGSIQTSGVYRLLALNADGTITWNSGAVWHAGNDGAGSGLDADLLDGKDTGTSGNVVPLLDGNNTYSGTSTFTGAATVNVNASTQFTVQRTDEGASGAQIDAIHVTTTQAVNDSPFTLRVIGRDSTNTATVYGRLRFFVTNATDTTEAGYWQIAPTTAGAETAGLTVTGTTMTFNSSTVWNAGNDGAGSGLDADLLDGYNIGTSGAAIPLLNGVNTWASSTTFTSTVVFNNVPTINSANPILQFYESDAGTDAKYWENFINAGVFTFRILNDAYGAASTIFSVTRTAHTAATFNFGSAITLQANANTIWHAGNDGAGSGLDADLLDGYNSSAFALLAAENVFTLKQTINLNTSAAASPGTTGVALHLSGSDSVATRLWLDSYGVATNYTARRSNGTNATKTALLAADVIMNNTAFGHDGTAYSTGSRGAMQIAASQNWAVGAHGTRLIFLTTADSTTTQTARWVIDQDGSLIYSGGSVTGAGTVNAVDYFDNGVNINTIYLAASTYTAADVLSKLLTVDGSGSGLDADLLDGYNVGTSGGAIPLMNGTNTWSGNQTITTTGTGSPLTLTSTDAGASAFTFDLYRNSASPAASDAIAAIRFRGENSTPATVTYGAIQSSIADTTAASEDAYLYLQTMIAGTLTNALTLGYASNQHRFTAPTDMVVAAVGANGYGSFYAIGSGTNNSYMFFGNATSGERSRITANNSRDFIVSNDGGVTSHLSVNSSGTVNVKSGFLTLGTASNPRLTIYNTAGTAATVVIGADSGTGWIGTTTSSQFSLYANSTERLRVPTSGSLLRDATYTIWDSNNDGSGSGLDADLLDGYNVGTSGGAIPLMNGTNTWSGTQTMSALTARVTLTTAVSGTLTSAHANISVELNGNVTLNNSVFTAGDKTVFDPGTSNRTFTRGAGVTMYVNGTDSATATLAANQIGGMHWRSASVVILTGAFT